MQVPVKRVRGAANRRPPRETTDADDSLSKREALEVIVAFETHNMGFAINISDSLVRESVPVANLTFYLLALINNIRTTLGSGSSMHQKIFSQIWVSEFILDSRRKR